MDPDRCPSAEDWAVFAAGASSEAEWRRRVRHLAECDVCRRQAGLLALSEGRALPPARLSAPPPPLAPRTRPSPLRALLRAAAAAVLLGAVVLALRSMRRAEPPEAPVVRESAAPRPAPERSAPRKPLPELPDALRPRNPAPETARPSREIFPPPPGLTREEPAVPETPAPSEPVTPPAPPAPPPAPAPSPFLALHAGSGVAEAVEISPGAGALTLDFDTTAEALSRTTYVRPTQALRTREGGSFSLPDGTVVHLARGGEVAVAWSQTLLCYTIDLHRGQALIDLGAAPRSLHVASGPLGVRLADSSGQIHLAADKDLLRTTPLTESLEFHTPEGDGRALPARQTLVLGSERDTLDAGPFDIKPASEFPTLDAAPARPAPRAPAALAFPGPSAAEILRALPTDSYRFRVSGRQLREGAWFPQGVLYSTIDDFAVVKRSDGSRPHARRGQRPWDDLGPVRPGTREDRLLQVLRHAQPPHAQIEIALAATRGDPTLRGEEIQARPCTISQYALDPARIRADVAALIDQAVIEGRMAKPDYLYWDTLEGSLEVTCTKADARLIRATDRRRVSYSYNSVGGLLRRSYALETVYEFFDHGKAALRLPDAILKEMDPGQK